MKKIMIFVDGTWLYYNKARLNDNNPNVQLDYGKLPGIIAEDIQQLLGGHPVDVVRTHFFGSYPDNCDPADEQLADRRRGFFAMLKDRYHYEISAFPTDFRGRRLKRQDRDPSDDFEPRQTCVDIALASEMMYYAALPYAVELLVLVGGARDFIPLLQLVRRLGKRTAIASIHGSCAGELCSAIDEYGVRDLPVIWLDELMDELRLPSRTGSRRPDAEWSDLDDEEEDNATDNEIDTNEEDWDDQDDEEEAEDATSPGDLITGVVKVTIEDRGFGFIVGSDGNDYFFHLSDLAEGVQFDELHEGVPVQFEVKRTPNHQRQRAGAAQNVTICEY